MKKTWWGALALVCCFSVGCGGCGEKKDVAEAPSPQETAPVPEPTEAPVDPVLAEVEALRVRAVELPSPDGADLAPREVFRRDALTLGNQGIEEPRLDVVVGVAEALWLAGESKTAAAFLQRSVGKNPAAVDGGKSHMHALARLKVEQGLALEAASLMERAIDIEPTHPEDFGLLSWAYLHAGRPGPATAATRRGLRAHPGDASLRVRAAEVGLVTEGAAAALEALADISPAPTTPEFLRVRGEAHLVAGDVDAARADAATLQASFGESPWGAVLLGAAGGPGSADALGTARSVASRRMAAVDARMAIPWAQSVAQGPRAPWTRSEASSLPPVESPDAQPPAGDPAQGSAPRQ